jgi:DegV family protein with EDD domain
MPQFKIRVVDSKSAAMAAGFVALVAAEASEAGGSVEEVVKASEEARDRVGLMAVMNTLQYLARSRRIPAVAAWAGDFINMKPILGIRNGEVKREGIAMSMRQGQVKILDSLEKDIRSKGGSARIAIIHTNAKEEAEEFKLRLLSRTNAKEVSVCPCTSVIGLYTGPGLLGIAYYLQQD